MIRIFGTMTDPSGSPVPGAIIELRAISSTNEVLLGSTVNHKCDQQGAYSFQLAAGIYDAYAQNDRCGDMDYLGTAKVSANSTDGDLHSILIDGGINITPPMLDSALAAAQRAESASALTAADRVSTGQNAESAKADSAAAKTAKDEAVSAASTAVSARDSIVADAKDVRSLATQVANQAIDVSAKHGDVVAKAAQVSAQADVVSTKHGEVVSKAAQVSDDASATQSAKSISVAAADTATQKAASAATHDASAQDAATRAENAASAVVGAVLDGGECDLSTGVYPPPITVAGKKYSTIWYVAVAGSVSGVAFDVGDLLRYTTAKTGYYFKVDAKDDVYSVNNEKGAVVITPEKIGAEKTGVAQQLVNQHASKLAAHPISGVDGLPEALAGKEATGAASSAVTAHEAKAGAHAISGVSGLQPALDAKPSRNILINGEVTRINQRGFNGSWAGLAIGAYGYDRWKKADATNMAQVVEAGNFIPGAKYRLSGTGVTASTLTAPASGDWTISVPQAARNVQLELGEVSTPFEIRNIQIELAMCQRYFQFGEGWFQGYGAAGSTVQTFSPFKVTMRSAPRCAVTYAPGGYGNVSGASGVVNEPVPSGVRVGDTLVALGNGFARFLYTADSEL